MRLVDIGYEPAFGARPLKRAILKSCRIRSPRRSSPAATRTAATVKVDVKGDEFVFTKT